MIVGHLSLEVPSPKRLLLLLLFLLSLILPFSLDAPIPLLQVVHIDRGMFGGEVSVRGRPGGGAEEPDLLPVH